MNIINTIPVATGDTLLMIYLCHPRNNYFNSLFPC